MDEIFSTKPCPRGRASPQAGLAPAANLEAFSRPSPLPSPPPLWFLSLPVLRHTLPTPDHQITVPAPGDKMPRLQGPGARLLQWLP